MKTCLDPLSYFWNVYGEVVMTLVDHLMSLDSPSHDFECMEVYSDAFADKKRNQAKH